MLRVGLTGGIACGKSTVAAMLVNHGAYLLQADGLAHELYAPGSDTYEKVVGHFGRDILNPDGTINRQKLADAAFPDRVPELNAIVHPTVLAAQVAWMKEIEHIDPHAVAVVEAALLLEAGAHDDFDKIIVVTCDFTRKVEHFAQRAGISPVAARVEVERRSAAQWPDEKKEELADYVIENSGSIERTRHQVEPVWRELQALARQQA